MTAQTPTYLKSKFENGDIPQGGDYEDVFDSYVNVVVSSEQIIAGPIKILGQLTVQTVSADNYNTQRITVSALTATVASAATSYNDLLKSDVVSANDLYSTNAFFVSARATLVSAGTAYIDAAKVNIVSANTVNSDTVQTSALRSTVVSAGTAFVDALKATQVSANGIWASIVTAGTNYIVSADMLRAIDVSALGTTQAAALLVEAPLVFVIQADGNNQSVKLPASVRGVRQTIVNASTTTLKIFPAVSARFLVTAVNASLNLLADKTLTVYHQGNDRYGTQFG